ncbi:SMI1/KNR4 family protein [Myxococcus vastator]|uniref:SMI1/KNR4 family protein n=1 Tax=Myxococcus vastator TaxID=2709664 RepID=UPI0013D824C7|nr:SMI1/KNR4 family protein [Myxococcus vastator]
MKDLLAEVSRLHFPNPPATPEQIEAFEHSAGWRLDPDLRAFYLHCNGARLFDRTDPAFAFVPLAELRRARIVMRNDDSEDAGPASWYALCRVRDSNFILLDVSEQHDGRYPLRDGYNEAFPDPGYCPKIAKSFREFLLGALKSEERWFWLSTDD